jgi:hypothetical protein
MGPGDAGDGLVPPSIAARSSEALWLAWPKQETVQVRRWNGRQWEDIPGPQGGRPGTYDPTVRVSSSGEAFLAWRAGETDQSDIHVARWDGAAWKPLGRPLSARPEPLTNANSAAMVLDDKGHPIVAWQEALGSDPRSLHVARWDGGSWAFLGKAVASGSELYSLEPALALDTSGRVWIAWNGGTEKRSYVRVARWNGRSWEDVGNTRSGRLRRSGEARLAQLIMLPGEQALVAWLDRGRTRSSLALERWSGARWERISPPVVPDGAQQAWQASLVPAQDGSPLLAWTETDSTDISSVHLQRLAADGWQPILSRMHLDPGQSDAAAVDLAVAAGGVIYLAWNEPDDHGQRVRVIRLRSCAAGESPLAPPPLRPRSSFWPKTVDAVVDDILARMGSESKARVRATPRDELIQFHHGWGTGIRNHYGLWRGNTALLESCGSKQMHPDSCSMVIIERLWERLQAGPPSP